MPDAAFSSNLSKPKPRKLSCKVRVMWPTRSRTSSWWIDTAPAGLCSDRRSVECADDRSTSGPYFVEFFENLRKFLVQRGRGKRLHHIAVCAGLRRRNDVFLFGFRGHHQY